MNGQNIRIVLMQLCKDLQLPVHGTNGDRLERIHNHLYKEKGEEE